MTLDPGTRLGPYEILAPLGAGGMGEVYRARDTRLTREVAIKVLPAAFGSDAERLRRFEKEARSASSLNHPNIVTVYDVGRAEGVSWIAMELVTGTTLRRVLSDGPLPLKRLLAIAAPIADALAKAHEIGIVHRDLKPENVMVTKDGIVKILDFGLAKRSDRSGENLALTQMPTASIETEAGVVLGTVPYMSPEQALGKRVDFRSDQFSFGSILYEAASGRRPFARASPPETMAAIIREEPKPLSVAAPGLPIALRWIVERCLAKEPDDRYGSSRDLALDLARLRDSESDGATFGGAQTATKHPFSGRTILFTIAALAVGLLLAVLANRRIPASPPVFRPLTFRRGSVGGARFAPDWNTVVYAAAWQGSPPQLFTTRLESSESTPLPLPSANLASVSRKGMLAIVLRRETTAIIAEVSLAGGAPRELVEGGTPEWLPVASSMADWSPKSDGLAIVRNRHLEFPIGKVLVPSTAGREVRNPRFSPDGRHIAFVEGGEGRFAIAVTDLDGKKTVLSDGWSLVPSLAWHPLTGEIWFSARENGTRFGVIELNAVSLSGARRVVARAPTLLIVEDIAPNGSVLLRSDDWPSTMVCLPPGGSRDVDLSWFDFSNGVDLSDDGRDIVFHEGGAAEGARGAVYMRKTDGSTAPVRLSDGHAVELSPDRKWILQIKSDGLNLLPTGAGSPRMLRDEGLKYRNAAWFRDGSRVVIEATEGERPPRLYVRSLAHGPSRPFTPEGLSLVAVSPDGKYVAATSANGSTLLYPVGGGEARALPELDGSRESVLRFDESGRSLFVAKSGMPLRIERLDLASGTRTLWKEIALADPTGVGGMSSVQITPDGMSSCYSFVRGLSRLYAVDGLR